MEMLICPSDGQAQKVEGYDGDGPSQRINLACGHSHPIANLQSPIFEVPDETSSTLPEWMGGPTEEPMISEPIYPLEPTTVEESTPMISEPIPPLEPTTVVEEPTP